MAARERTGSDSSGAQVAGRRSVTVKVAVGTAIERGFLVGRPVMVGNIPGTIVGYNIAHFGRFLGDSYPLVVRTAFGVTKCGLDELSLT